MLHVEIEKILCLEVVKKFYHLLTLSQLSSFVESCKGLDPLVHQVDREKLGFTLLIHLFIYTTYKTFQRRAPHTGTGCARDLGNSQSVGPIPTRVS